MTSVVSEVNTEAEERLTIVDKMIAGGRLYLGCPRFQFTPEDDNMSIDEFYTKFGNNNKAPYYCTNEDNLEWPKNEEDRKNFPMVCYGFTNLMLRHGGVPIPFCEPEMLKNKKHDDLRYGVGGADEWMAAFYDKIEPFDRKGIYPRGTLLLRNLEPLTYGHTALLIESSTVSKPVSTCKVIHSAGDSLCNKKKDPLTGKNIPPLEGTCDGVCVQHLSDQLEYFTPKFSKWDKDRKFPNVPEPGFDYYQAILRPKHYINLDKVEALKEERESLKKKLEKPGRGSPGLNELAGVVMGAFGFTPVEEQHNLPLKF